MAAWNYLFPVRHYRQYRGYFTYLYLTVFVGISSLVVIASSFGCSHQGQAGATREGTFFNACHAVGNVD